MVSGSGTSSDPWTIANEADLETIAGNSSYWASDTYIVVTADITCTGTHTPIGDSTTAYQGSFDGQNHTITNMTIVGTQNAGMFGYCGGAFNVSNFKLVNGSATATGGGTSAMVIARGSDASTNGAVVSNIETDHCVVTNSQSWPSGGIMGSVFYGTDSSQIPTCTNCYVHDGSVVGSGSAGGIAVTGTNGAASYSVFQNCKVERMFIGSDSYGTGGDTGGICGTGTGLGTVTIDGCEVTDSVVTGCSYIGGIVGQAYPGTRTTYYHATATISNCSVKNTLIYARTGDAGGICGYAGINTYDYSTSTTISNCSVDRCTIATNSTNAGGIYGSNNLTSTSSTLHNKVTIVSPSVSNCTIISTNYAGGIVA